MRAQTRNLLARKRKREESTSNYEFDEPEQSMVGACMSSEAIRPDSPRSVDSGAHASDDGFINDDADDEEDSDVHFYRCMRPAA